MLKKTALKKILLSSIAFLVMILICIFPKNNEYSIPEEVIYVSEITMPIYVMDTNGYVARTSIIKNNKNDIESIVESLTIDTVSNNTLPSGFTGLIPKNTKLLDYELKDGLLKLNFSKEFLNVSIENEEKLIEALIYSLCELPDVDKIMIFVENEKLNSLPNSGKILPIHLDKSFGINKVYHIDDIKNTTKTTIYYIGKFNDSLYYIPITKVTNESLEKVEIIVKELKSIPIYETNLISYLNAAYELKDYEILENSITLSFNNKLLTSLTDDEKIEEVKYTLALSLKDTYNINDVIINIA